MTNFKPTCVVLFSGGLDSGVLVHQLLSDGETVLGLTAAYGSRHNRLEQAAADKLGAFFNDKYPGNFQTARFDLEPIFMHCDGPMFKGSKVALPTGHFNDPAQRATVVPGRNLVLIAVAASLAESVGAGRVVVGAHEGDHAVYPDCRPLFVEAARYTVQNSTDQKVTLSAPWLWRPKAEIVKAGIGLGFPFRLTRTCYSGWAVACGVCASCQERLTAFAENGVDDPLEYTARDLIPAAPCPAAGSAS